VNKTGTNSCHVAIALNTLADSGCTHEAH